MGYYAYQKTKHPTQPGKVAVAVMDAISKIPVSLVHRRCAQMWYTYATALPAKDVGEADLLTLKRNKVIEQFIDNYFLHKTSPSLMNDYVMAIWEALICAARGDSIQCFYGTIAGHRNPAGRTQAEYDADEKCDKDVAKHYPELVEKTKNYFDRIIASFENSSVPKSLCSPASPSYSPT